MERLSAELATHQADMQRLKEEHAELLLGKRMLEDEIGEKNKQMHQEIKARATTELALEQNEAAVAALTASDSEKQSQLEGMQAELASLKESSSSDAASVAEIQGKVAELESMIAAKDAELKVATEKEADMDGVSGQLTAQNKQLTEEKKEVQEALYRLEAAAETQKGEISLLEEEKKKEQEASQQQSELCAKLKQELEVSRAVCQDALDETTQNQKVQEETQVNSTIIKLALVGAVPQ